METFVTQQVLLAAAAGLAPLAPKNADSADSWTFGASPRRQAVLDARRALLRQVKSRTIGEIRVALSSSGGDPSERAFCMRRANRLFGVCAGGRWRYPEFQFDAEGQVYPEIGLILPHLPDETGWLRLRWFLTPNEKLDGWTPLRAWTQDRARVTAVVIEENFPFLLDEARRGPSFP